MIKELRKRFKISIFLEVENLVTISNFQLNPLMKRMKIKVKEM